MQNAALVARPVIAPEDVARCYGCIGQLHSAELTQDAFADRMLLLMRDHAYQLACIEIDGQVAAAAAFQVQEGLSYGRHMMLDAIAALPEYRNRGLGTALLDYVAGAARQAGCEALRLNTNAARLEARRFYYRYGMDLVSFHFCMSLRD